MKNKTLLVDGNNIFMRCLFNTTVDPEGNFDHEYWEFLTFYSLYKLIVKFKADEVVFALDNNSWRKVLYPLYKADRKKKKEKLNIDWNRINNLMDEFSQNWKQHFPIKIIKNFGSEADDVIGVLTKYITNDIIVISTDEDYKQLLKYKHVEIYEPIKKKFRKQDDLNKFMEKLYICGQSKDNIYNIFTPLNNNGERKKPLGEVKFEKIYEIGVTNYIDKVGLDEVRCKEGYEQELRKRYNLNKRLINFDYIPKSIEKNIVEEYNSCKFNELDNIYQYFKKKNWQGLLEQYQYVENTLTKLY